MLPIPPPDERQKEQKREKFRIGKLEIFEHIYNVSKLRNSLFFDVETSKRNANVVRRVEFVFLKKRAPSVFFRFSTKINVKKSFFAWIVREKANFGASKRFFKPIF